MPRSDPGRSDPGHRPDPAEVLTKAVLRASELLGVAQKDLAHVLGVSAASISRMPARTIDPASKEGELAVLFVRLFRSLDALLGGDAEKCKRWLHAYNDHLLGTPAELIHKVTGLNHVVEYLDAMRGKL